ncbi:MAG: hypothetical protein ACO3NA_07120 [Flavobacteriaceae bacterium]
MKMNILLFSICLVFAVTLQTAAQKNTNDSLLTVELQEVENSTINARFTNGNLNEKYLPGIAKDFGSVQLQQNLKNDASIKLGSIYRGNIHANNDNTVTIPKTIILSLEASKGFNPFKLTAGIQNVLNKQYSDNVRINAFGARFYEAAIPRQGFVRMRYQL